MKLPHQDQPRQAIDATRANEFESNVVAPLLRDAVLSKCNYQALARVLPHVTQREFQAGEMIYRAGQKADELFVLLSGSVHLEVPEATKIMFTDKDGNLVAVDSKTVATTPRRTTVTDGHFGEESGTDAVDYVADAVAATAVTALAVPRTHLAEAIAATPSLKTEFYFSLINHFSAENVVRSRAAPERKEVTEKPDWFKTVGWLAALLVPIGVYLARSALGLPDNAGIFLAIFSATIVMWVFSLTDEYVPGLFAVLVTLALGIVPAPVVLSGFASDGFFLAMSILGLGTVIVASGLSYRFLLWLLMRLPNTRFWHNMGLILTGVLLTPMVPSINGRVALTAPFMIDMADILRLPRGGPAATLLATSAFTGASLLSAVFLSSKSVNFVVYGLLPAQGQDQFQWLPWFLSASATGAIMLAAYLLLAAVFFRGSDPASLSREQIASQFRLIGRMKNREWAAVFGIVIFMLGVVTSSIHGIQPPWIGLAILYAMLLFGFLRKSEFKERIDWPFLVYLGGIVGIVAAFNYVGLAAWMAQHLSGLGEYMQRDFPLFVALLFAIIALIRLAVPISATIVVAATVFMPLAGIYGVNPWLVGFIILVLGEMWFLPYQCSYYLQFREIARDGVYDEKRFLIFNALMNAAKLGAVYASIPFWRAMGLL
ncbi:MAG: anion permease [Burkholderiales bacterium]|nr:anion permease [Burkholderiales bacterium]